MTAEVAIVPGEEVEAERKRKLALLKAVGLDRVAPEQRELALAIAKRYDLDLLLKHLVLIDGRPYITRDGLLWIAHRSGQLDGIEVTKPVVEDDYWYVEATVYRRDMSHGFKYGGRYPTKGGNQKFAPEMATKVAESMALRRAFNISAPSADERWDVDVPAAEPEPPKSLAEKAAERAQAVKEPYQTYHRVKDGQVVEVTANEFYAEPQTVDAATGEILEATPAPKGTMTAKQTTPTTELPTKQCESISKLSGEQCRREHGHGQLHRTENEAWTDEDAK